MMQRGISPLIHYRLSRVCVLTWLALTPSPPSPFPCVCMSLFIPDRAAEPLAVVHVWTRFPKKDTCGRGHMRIAAGLEEVTADVWGRRRSSCPSRRFLGSACGCSDISFKVNRQSQYILTFNLIAAVCRLAFEWLMKDVWPVERSRTTLLKVNSIKM